MFGLEIVVSLNAINSLWAFPKDPFVSYGPEDESWARCCNFGREVYLPGVFRVGSKLIMHPKIYEEIQKRTKDAAKQMAEENERRFEELVCNPWHTCKQGHSS